MFQVTNKKKTLKDKNRFLNLDFQNKNLLEILDQISTLRKINLKLY